MAYFRRVYFSSILRVGLVAALRIVSSCTTCVLHFRFETSLALLHSAHKTCFDINFTLYTGFRCGFFLASFDFVSYICVCVFFLSSFFGCLRTRSHNFHMPTLNNRWNKRTKYWRFYKRTKSRNVYHIRIAPGTMWLPVNKRKNRISNSRKREWEREREGKMVIAIWRCETDDETTHSHIKKRKENKINMNKIEMKIVTLIRNMFHSSYSLCLFCATRARMIWFPFVHLSLYSGNPIWRLLISPEQFQWWVYSFIISSFYLARSFSVFLVS